MHRAEEELILIVLAELALVRETEDVDLVVARFAVRIHRETGTSTGGWVAASK